MTPVDLAAVRRLAKSHLDTGVGLCDCNVCELSTHVIAMAEEIEALRKECDDQRAILLNVAKACNGVSNGSDTFDDALVAVMKAIGKPF